MLEQPQENLDPRAFYAWFWRGIFIGAFLLVLITGFSIINRLWLGWGEWWIWILLVFTIILTLLEAIIIPKLRLKFWRYELNEEEIDIQHGILIIKRSLIPMIRVQHVDTEHGPILRRFGLATLRIYTAGTTHRIPALDAQNAHALRRQIAYLAQVSDEDV